MKKLAEFILNFVAKILSLNSDVLYYLITKPLKTEAESMLKRFNAYDHIDRAMLIAGKKYDAHSNFIIVDVGGGIGTTAEMFSKQFKIPVYIFEPIKSNIEILQNKSKAYPQWKIFHKALGSFSQESVINITKNMPSSSLLEVFSNDTDTEISKDDLFSTIFKEKIVISTLDEEISTIDKKILILKIDVQGYELEVLKGSINSLNHISIIVLEMSNHNDYVGAPKYFELDDILRRNNFKLFDFYPSIRDSTGIKEWDSIYINNQH